MQARNSMQTNHIRFRLGSNGRKLHLQPTGFMAKVVTVAMAALIVVAAFVFSLLVLAVAAAGGLLIFGYVWWKTRKLRRQLREHSPGGRVIEGELIRDVEPHDTIRR
jgi:Flp pilus assembly protein TadB